MKYGFRDGDRTLVVVAASSLSELVDFQKDIQANPGRFSGVTMLTYLDMEDDERFVDLQQPPIVIEFNDAAEIDGFAGEAEIAVSGPNRAIGFARPMMLGHRDAILSETRTIAEITGTDKNDPWDKRTPAQKAAAEKAQKASKEAYDKAKEAGTLSGDSFAVPGESGLQITDVDMTTDKDGTIRVDTITAVKGLHDIPDAEMSEPGDVPAPKPTPKKRSGGDQKIGQESFTGEKPDEATEVRVVNLDENGDDLVIAHDGLVSLYFKVSVTGAKLDELRPLFEAKRFAIDGHTVVQRDNTGGCWYACIRKAAAEEILAIVQAAGHTAELSAANPTGEPVGYKDQVVDRDAPAETPIRPWNARAAEYAALSDEEREKNRKAWSGDEFVCSLSYTLNGGNIMVVTPASYFEEHGEMYPEDLDILHMLPGGTKKIGFGRYRALNYDENSFDFEILNRRKFRTGLNFQLYLNLEGLN